MVMGSMDSAVESSSVVLNEVRGDVSLYPRRQWAIYGDIWVVST